MAWRCRRLGRKLALTAWGASTAALALELDFAWFACSKGDLNDVLD
jgi:hypothetical protein